MSVFLDSVPHRSGVASAAKCAMRLDQRRGDCCQRLVRAVRGNPSVARQRSMEDMHARGRLLPAGKMLQGAQRHLEESITIKEFQPP